MVEFQCAVAARDRDEPMFATASQVRRWLLIEVRGAWGRDAVADSDLARYAPAAGGGGCRPSRSGSSPSAATSIAPRRTPCRCSTSTPAAAPIVAVLAPPGRHAARAPSTPPPTCRSAVTADALAPSSATRSYSCARTVATIACCATFGRPLARVLRQGARRDDVWECSHIGGDRFAANLVILPEGLYFGRCDGDAAERVIDDYQRRCDPPRQLPRSLGARLLRTGRRVLRPPRARPDVDRRRHRRSGASTRRRGRSPSTSTTAASTRTVEVHVARTGRLPR